MRELVSFNHQIVPAGNVSVSGVSSAALYGKGIFTTVAIYDGLPFLWETHWRRLLVNSAKLNIDMSNFSEAAVKYSLNEILNENALVNGRARTTILDESANGIWPYGGEFKTSILITTANSRDIPGDFKLTVSPFRLNSASPLAGIKSCNYLEKIAALNEAKDRGFDEAICINERCEITSACMANIFWLRDGKLFTPPLETGCLAGTTREHVMENAECFEVPDGLESLANADAIFLTSAGIGVVQVAEIDGRKLPKTDHLILDLVPGKN
ncbi:MAG: aminotransferase class IV [Pyrinomonadaceae bacterium]